MNTSGLTKINSIVDEVMVEFDTHSDSDYLRYARFVERGLRELSIFHLNNSSSDDLEVDSFSNTAPLPSDFIRLVELGIVLSNGKLYTLTKDSSIAIPNGVDCGRNVKNETENTLSSSSQPLHGYYYTGDNYTYDYAKFARRGGVSEYGKFTIDLENYRIVFGAGFNESSVRIKYISSGISIDKETFIPEVAREALVSYVKWKATTNKMSIPMSERREKKKEYYQEVIKMGQANGPTLDELIDAIYQSTTQIASR
jgi:hypothetical protein